MSAKPILVTVADAADALAISVAETYRLAAEGKLEKKYIGNGKRNFRLTYASLERYAEGLSQDPVAS